MKKDIIVLETQKTDQRDESGLNFVKSIINRDENSRLQYHFFSLDLHYKGIHVKTEDGFLTRALKSYTMIKHIWDEMQGTGQQDPVVYILGSECGLFFKSLYKKFKRAGIQVYFNPGNPWHSCAKENVVQRVIRNHCTETLLHHADTVVCNSKNLQKHLKQQHPGQIKQLKTVLGGHDFAAEPCHAASRRFVQWCEKHALEPNEYFLSIGSLAPENNYENIIREFLQSDTDKKLVILADQMSRRYYRYLCKELLLHKQNRIQIVFEKPDKALMAVIRTHAFAAICGNELPGTDASLLESLEKTKVTLLIDSEMHREMAGKYAMYWNNNENSLQAVIEESIRLKNFVVDWMDKQATEQARRWDSWPEVATAYETLFACPESKLVYLEKFAEEQKPKHCEKEISAAQKQILFAPNRTNAVWK